MSSSSTIAFEFPGLRVGVAAREDGPTGVTVFHFPNRAYATVDTRGGAPGSSLTETLKSSFGKYVDAIVFAGGSAYGLEAAAGVAARLLDSGRASSAWGEIAIVPAAVVYDFKGRTTKTYPNRELGIMALQDSREGTLPQGAYGAGRFVHCGSYFGEQYMEQSGQGSAFGRYGSTTIGVVTVVNSRGAIVDRSGKIVCGNRDPRSGRRTPIAERVVSQMTPRRSDKSPAGLTDNTTLTLVVTNRFLDRDQLQRLAIGTHAAMARSIQPFHTYRDGDTLFAVSTGERHSSTPDFSDLSVLASELAWDAVLSCVPSNYGDPAVGTASCESSPRKAHKRTSLSK